MNRLFSWIVALLVTLPVAFQIGQFAGKPVDLVASDLLILLVVFVPRRRDLVIPRGMVLWRLAFVRVAAGTTLLYCLGLAASSYAHTSEFGRIVSAAKFAKPLAFVLLGSYFASVMRPLELLHRIGLAFAVISMATLVTAVATPGFPQVAWGKNLFAFPVYGWRNSVMTLYAVMVPLLMACADVRRTQLGKWAVRGAALLTGMIVITSLSRSSTVVLACAVMFYLYFTGRIYLPLFAAAFGMLMFTTFSSVFDAILANQDVMLWVERLTWRMSHTVGAEDPLSGRDGIWALTIDLWSEKPVFGYAFESFSRYAEFDTPHQQYLEMLYKSGALGAALYGLVLVSSWFGLLHLSAFAMPQSRPWFLLRALMATFGAVMIGNLSQPNLTYSVTGNFLFFAIGLAMNKHAAAALVMRSRSHLSGTVSSRPTPQTHGLDPAGLEVTQAAVRRTTAAVPRQIAGRRT